MFHTLLLWIDSHWKAWESGTGGSAVHSHPEVFTFHWNGKQTEEREAQCLGLCAAELSLSARLMHSCMCDQGKKLQQIPPKHFPRSCPAWADEAPLPFLGSAAHAIVLLPSPAQPGSGAAQQAHRACPEQGMLIPPLTHPALLLWSAPRYYEHRVEGEGSAGAIAWGLVGGQMCRPTGAACAQLKSGTFAEHLE